MADGAQQNQQQQINQEIFDKLKNNEQKKVKTSSSKSQYSNWVSKLGSDILYICGFTALFCILKTIFSSNQKANKNNISKLELNVTNEKETGKEIGDNNNLAKISQEAENQQKNANISTPSVNISTPSC